MAGDYQAKVKHLYDGLKAIQRYDELMARSISLPDNMGYLICASELFANDDHMIGLCAKWREEATTFHNRFKVTLEGTKRWYRKLLLEVPDRILFFVLNRYGMPIGHMGFANTFHDDETWELDNVVRGVSSSDRGIMSISTQALFAWADQTAKPKGYHLRTLEDNTHAIQFYQKLGFVLTGKQPLRRIEKNGEINHLPLSPDDKAPPDKHFVCMNYVRK